MDMSERRYLMPFTNSSFLESMLEFQGVHFCIYIPTQAAWQILHSSLRFCPSFPNSLTTWPLDHLDSDRVDCERCEVQRKSLEPANLKHAGKVFFSNKVYFFFWIDLRLTEDGLQKSTEPTKYVSCQPGGDEPAWGGWVDPTYDEVNP